MDIMFIYTKTSVFKSVQMAAMKTGTQSSANYVLRGVQPALETPPVTANPAITTPAFLSTRPTTKPSTPQSALPVVPEVSSSVPAFSTSVKPALPSVRPARTPRICALSPTDATGASTSTTQLTVALHHVPTVITPTSSLASASHVLQAA